MTSETRRVQRGVGAALLALAFLVIVAVPMAHADTIYPDNQITGTSFDNGLDGWSEFSNSCVLLSLGGADLGVPTNPDVCSPHTDHSAGHGTPPGSLEQYSEQAVSVDVLGAVGVVRGTATALSPVFLVPTGGAATFTVDRRFTVESVLPIGLLDNDVAQFNYNFFLIDQADPLNPLTLDGDTVLTPRNEDPAFTGHGPIALPAGSVQSGHSYRIEVTTTFRANTQNLATVIAAVYTARAQYDNVRLRVVDGTPRFGPATATTTDATDITGTTATLNGTTNAQGSPSTYDFRYGTTMAMTQRLPAAAPDFNAGTGVDDQDRSRPVTGLTPCTQYFFQIEAQNAQNAVGTPSLGGIKTFMTDCAPLATTLDATGVGPNAATLNSAINPRGSDTTYFYEYGLDSLPAGTFSARIPLLADGNFPSIGEGGAVVQPNSAVLGGLTPETTYRYRVTAVNAVGTSAPANIVTFRTPGVGAQGPPGTNGTNGTNGTDGTNGTNGANGAPGPQGPAGQTGSSGPPGPRGPTGSAGEAGQVLNINNGDPRALIRIYGQSIVVPRRGRNIGRVRVKIFCRTVAVLTCSGNVKVRSLNVIAPQSFGARPTAKRRVTFATDAVQLDVRKIGFAILNFNAQRRSVLRREKSVQSTVIVTVIDAANNRQNIRAVLPVRLGK